MCLQGVGEGCPPPSKKLPAPPPKPDQLPRPPPPPPFPFDSTCLSRRRDVSIYCPRCRSSWLSIFKYVFPVLVWSRFGSDFLYTRAIFQLYCVDFFFKAIFYSQIGEWHQAPGITYSSPLFNLCGCLRRNCAEYGVCRLKSLRDWRRIMWTPARYVVP